MKVQYMIIPYSDCFNASSTGIKIADIWDYVDQENRNNIQFCVELYKKINPSFLKVYENDKYLIIKMFSLSIQLELKKPNYLEYKI
jgi:Q-cell neuroblast polarisation